MLKDPAPYSTFMQDLFTKAKPSGKDALYSQFITQQRLSSGEPFGSPPTTPTAQSFVAPTTGPNTLLGGIANGVPEMNRWYSAFMKQGPAASQAQGTLTDPSNDSFLSRMIWALRNVGQKPLL